MHPTPTIFTSPNHMHFFLLSFSLLVLKNENIHVFGMYGPPYFDHNKVNVHDSRKKEKAQCFMTGRFELGSPRLGPVWRPYGSTVEGPMFIIFQTLSLLVHIFNSICPLPQT